MSRHRRQTVAKMEDEAEPEAEAKRHKRRGMPSVEGWHLLDNNSLKNADWGWTAAYCYRGLLARLLVDVTEDKTRFENSIESITAVKFFSRQSSLDAVKVEEYRCFSNLFLTPDEMLSAIARCSPHFRKDATHVKHDSPFWKDVKTQIDNFGLQYNENDISCEKDSVGWHPTAHGLDEGHDREAASLVTDLVIALDTGFYFGGEFKMSWKPLTEAVRRTLDIRPFAPRFIKSNTPPLRTNQNTKIEMVAPENSANWNRTYSTEPPEAKLLLPPGTDADYDDYYGFPTQWPSQFAKKLPVHKASVVVPDATWALPNSPGQFPLVVELRRANGLMEGMTQCYKKMLSRFFFQEAIFGLLLTPRHYVLLFAHKENHKKIRLYLQNPVHFGEADNTLCFSSDKFLAMVETLCKIMDWAGRLCGRHE